MGGPSKQSFAVSKGIHPSTFQYYAQNDVIKRRNIGGMVVKNSVAVVLAATSATARATHSKPNTKRIFHTVDKKMGEAVKEWNILKTSVGTPSKKSFSLSKVIVPSKFHKYAHNDASKRRKIGGRVGKLSVVSASNVEFSV